MFKTAATVFLGLAISSVVLAQQPKHQDQRQQQPRTPRPETPPKSQKPPKQAPIQNPELTVERLRKRLRLNNDQVFQLRTIVNNRNLEIARTYQDGSTAASRRLTLDSIQQHFQGEVRTLLTPGQIDRFDRALLGHSGAFR
jgi:hypothetical protein